MNADSQVSHPSTDELLQHALGESDEDARWNLVRALQLRFDRELLPTFSQLAQSECPQERELASDVLAQGWKRDDEKDEYLADQAGALLIRMLEKEQDMVVLQSICFALGHLHESRAVDALLDYKDHPLADVRYAVVHGLKGIDEPEAIAALIDLSADDDPDVRNWATFGLGSLIETDSEAIREALANRLAEEDGEIRGEALVGLALRRDKRVIEPLLRDFSNNTAGGLAEDAANEIKEFATNSEDTEWICLVKQLDECGAFSRAA
ncbi:MAG: HEAT repeat domain-containing protein [Verrucomicrobia bacterium]|nr:HEAT repeat domain-containing protein [Verrucomicrobiota bacterium]